MKKRNLKSLSLNKTTISNLQQMQVNGGRNILAESDTCITTAQSGEPPKASCGSC